MMKQAKLKFPVRMFALLCGLLLSVGAFAQNISVNGHVKDANGEPIIGATVRVDGTTAGAISDLDGNFTLEAAKGSTLSVSYVGYTTAKVTVAPNVMVTLQEDTKALNEVVVIGYGTAKKEDLTGSVAAINPDEMSKGITNNASDMLVGKVAGVDVQTAGGAPGAGAQIRIRGGASLTASNDPLYVIDGLVIDNNTATGMSNILAMINPNDIETFTVLKDASAAAIYGSRASNGVIIITTKKGRAGSKPKFSYNGDITLSTIAKKYDVLSGDQYRDLVSKVSPENLSSLGTANNNWQNHIFKDVFSHHHSLSMSGGLKNMPYRVSVGIDNDKGIVKTSWMDRFNASVNLAPSFLKDHLRFNITAKYMYEKDRYADAGAAIGGALAMDPTQPVMGVGDAYKFFDGYYQTLNNASYADASWKYTSNSVAPQNPVAFLNQHSTLANANDLSGNIEADYKIHGFEDLHIHASLGSQYTDSHRSEDISPYSFSNNYYGYQGAKRYYKYNIVGNAYLQYAHTFGVHGIDIMAGAEDSHYHRSGYEIGGATNHLGEASTPSATLRESTEWATHNSLVSYFGRLNYNLLERYLLTVTFRADGSSRFAKGNKWGYFPAAAFAWRINKEPFLKNVQWINDFKLRLGWGMTGQQNGIDDFYYAPLYVESNEHAQYPFGNTYYYTVRPNAYNPDLTWEKTTTYNAGIDFAVLNNRVSLSADYYYRKTRDLLSRVNITSGTNFGDQMLKNIGSLSNYGVEFTIDARPIVTKDFTWQVTYNVGWNHNRITKLDAGAQDWVEVTDTKISPGNNTRIQRNKVGEAVNSFYVYQQAYDKDGKPLEGVVVDRNADGQINDDDRYYYKDPAPDIVMGLTTKFIYKNWDLSASFHASLGNYVYYDFLSLNANLSPSGLFSNSSFHNKTPENVALGWTGTTPVQNYLSDYFVRNASFVKCSNITLGYSFPSLVTTRTGIKTLDGRVFFTVQNPFMITNYDGIDPEVSNGIDSNPYPRPRSFQLGVNLNF
jgi:iron complex outermembrane receptor protein